MIALILPHTMLFVMSDTSTLPVFTLAVVLSVLLYQVCRCFSTVISYMISACFDRVL